MRGDSEVLVEEARVGWVGPFRGFGLRKVLERREIKGGLVVWAEGSHALLELSREFFCPLLSV